MPVTVLMASVDPGEVILSGVGVVSGVDLSGSATAVMRNKNKNKNKN